MTLYRIQVQEGLKIYEVKAYTSFRFRVYMGRDISCSIFQ